jgi:hypothetical protein
VRLKIQIQMLLCLFEASEPVNRAEHWAIGGGAGLELLWKHRQARDLDVFLYNPMVFAFLSPRTNDFYERIGIDAAEGIDSISWRSGGVDISIVCTAPLTDSIAEKFSFEDQIINIESPHEILARKLHHRASSLTVNDLFDVAHYVQLYPPIHRNELTASLLTDNRELLRSRAEEFQEPSLLKSLYSI